MNKWGSDGSSDAAVAFLPLKSRMHPPPGVLCIKRLSRSRACYAINDDPLPGVLWLG